MNTVKEKALELIEKFRPQCYCFLGSGMLTNTYDESVSTRNAKQCAIIAVNETINELQQYSDMESTIIFNESYSSVIERLLFWQEIKQELEKI